MESLRKNWPLLLAVAVIVLFGVLAVSTLLWLARESDPKYIPLIGACITGMTSLLSIVLAGLGAWAAYWNLANPFRVELHKRQTEVVCELVELAWQIYNRLWMWERDRPEDGYGKHLEAF